jgi:hypothetical protein
MGQEGILLAFIKTMHFVNEQDRAFALCRSLTSLINRSADILNA